MNTETHEILVAGVPVQVVRKAIRNLHLGVHPPDGRVRIAVPLAVSDDAVRRAIIGKLSWIKRQRKRFQEQPRQSQRRMVSGESHYFLGHRYRLAVLEAEGPSRVSLKGSRTLQLKVRPGLSALEREQVLSRWYRAQVKTLIPAMLERWQHTLGVQITAWGVKKMKTKWGSCNAKSGRIWLNLELAKKPLHCLEYIVLHELAHLREPKHNERFVAILDEHMPTWRAWRDELNAAPLGHETWKE